jgi:thioredoxin reductase
MAMAADRRLRILFNSNVKEIHDHAVVIQQGDTTGSIRNDAVIISAGGILPSGFLREVGIAVETKYGTA